MRASGRNGARAPRSPLGLRSHVQPSRILNVPVGFFFNSATSSTKICKSQCVLSWWVIEKRIRAGSRERYFRRKGVMVERLRPQMGLKGRDLRLMVIDGDAKGRKEEGNK